MQLGIGSYSLPWAVGVPQLMPPLPMQAKDLLYLAAKHGVQHVQFGDNLPLHTLPEDEMRELKETAASLHLHIEVGTRRLTEENIGRYLGLTNEFRSPFLRVVIDDTDFHPAEEEVITTIKRLLPLLEQRDIVLAIENHDRFPARVLERIIQQTNPHVVGICLDTANSLGAGEGIETVVQVLAPYSVNLHIKDIGIERVPHKMGFAVFGCAAGRGILNIPQIIATVKSYNRCKTATLEIWSNPEETMEATLAKERQWFEASIEYLGKLLQ